MNRMRYLLFLWSALGFAQSCANIPVGFNLAANAGQLNGFVPFPQSSYWHRNISSAIPDTNSAAYIADINAGGNRPFTNGYPASIPGATWGATYHVVTGSEPRVNVYFDVPATVATFTNGSTAITWVSGNYFEALTANYGNTLAVASMAGNWFQGAGVNYTITSTGGCSSGSFCTTATLGTPYAGLTGNHAIVNTSVASQSDPGPMPIPLQPRVSYSITPPNPYPNYTASLTTDAKLTVIDKDNCVLYELFRVGYDGHNVHAGVAAVFDLLGGDNQRPVMWPSASVSGVPYFAGQLRDEELNGSVPINHPIAVTFAAYPSGSFFPHHSWIAPAELHQYGSGAWHPWWTPTEVPFGAILRLKSSFDVSPFPAQAQLILNAMKQYGLILVDGGTTLSADGLACWNYDYNSSQALFQGSFGFGVSQFDVITNGNPVYCDALYAAGNLGHAPVCPNDVANIVGSPPTVLNLMANGGSSNIHAAAGSTVTLTWNVANATNRISFVTPNVGPVVTTSAQTVVWKTTTYSVYAENFFGAATPATITVTVP
jgi:hypothetical protein